MCTTRSRSGESLETRERSLTLHDRIDRSNHLTLVRLVLALLVIFSHTFALGGFGDEFVLGGNDKYGNLAVNGFFVVSGMLISVSFVRTKSILHFIRNRGLRLLPAYWLSLLLSALVLCPLAYWLGGGNAAEYWTPATDSPFTYVAKNIALRVYQTGIADVFRDNPYPRMVNGVLWTLIYEVTCYGFVVVVGVLGLLKRHWGWLVALLALMASNTLVYAGAADYFPTAASSLLALLHFLAYFVAGIVAHLYADKIRIGADATLLSAAGLCFLLLVPIPVVFYAYHLLAPPVLVVFIFGIAFSTSSFAGEQGMPDLSYGLYIYGWVVQQILASIGVAEKGFAAFLGSSLILSSVLAAISYYGIERRALSWKRATRSH